MKHFYDPDEYFLVGNIETRKIYVVPTFYKVLFKSNQPADIFPCYLYLGKGNILKETRHYIARQQLDYAKELLPKSVINADTKKIKSIPSHIQMGEMPASKLNL